MKTVYKYKLCSALFGDSVHIIPIKKGAKFLKIARQYDDICLWAFVDPNEEDEEYICWQIGTGHPIEDETGITEKNYVGTVVCDDVGYVWNIFIYKSYDTQVQK